MNKPLSSGGRSAAGLDLPADPPRAGESKQAWVYRQIRLLILNGALPSGARLPSTRSLAQSWHVARSTVEAAYDQLHGEGYTAGSVGSGTYVAAVIPDNFFGRGASGEAASMASLSCAGPARGDGAALPESATAATAAPSPRSGLPFVSRSADAALFSMETWRRGLMASARRVTPAQLGYDDPQGWRPLRVQIARYLGAARGIACEADQVIVLAGIRDGLDLSGSILLGRQDKVLIEDPGYLNAKPIFGRHTDRVVPLPIDEHGFQVALARRQGEVKLVHVTPAHQSPIGLTMPVSRRLELLDWAGQSGCWIVEDDYDSEFNYDGAPLSALKSLDTADRVIHCGSFNKTLFNALRIGYAVVPRTLAPTFVQALRRAGRASSLLEQMTLAGFLEDGGFARHIRRARAVYARRRDALLEMLRQAVGVEALRVSGQQAGFHLVWWLPEGWNLPALIADARALGVGLEPLSDFCRHVELPQGVVIGYSAVADEVLEQFGALLLRHRAQAAPACRVQRKPAPSGASSG